MRDVNKRDPKSDTKSGEESDVKKVTRNVKKVM